MQAPAAGSAWSQLNKKWKNRQCSNGPAADKQPAQSKTTQTDLYTYSMR